MFPDRKDSFAVMVTRSGKAGLQLTESLQKKGIHCWFIPTLKIIGQELLMPMVDFQQAIFVSQNAVKYSVEINESLRKLLPDQLIAVGPGTAHCLEESGFNSVILPTHYNSEGLLQLAQLQAVKGQQLLIVKGRGGRSLLVETLTERGAICHNLEVYCRVTAQLDDGLWRDFLAHGDGKNSTRMVTIASVDAMQALNSNLAGDLQQQQLTLVVASQRIADTAQKLGYKQIIIAGSASNNAMLAAVIAATEK